MKDVSVAARMDQLINQIEHHRQLYYGEDQPQISDAEYDGLERELRQLEAENPELIRPDSPSFRVGGVVADGHAELAHRTPMLSLDNAYSREELERFLNRVVETLGEDQAYAVELKIDGLSLSVVYRHGLLAKAVTRGNGRSGEDVTENAKTIRNLPLRVDAWKDFEEMEIRGEVYMSRSSFSALNESRLKAGLPLFANPRNSAAGSLRMLDSREVARRQLLMFVYQPLGPWAADLSSHFERLQHLAELGFPVNPHNCRVDAAEDLYDLIETWTEKRHDLDYETDGLVLKLDQTQLYEEMGYTAKFPKWATAYKFPAEQASTRIEKIEIQVGRTGVLTPVAHFEAVQLAGTTVTRATLHNFDEIRKKDIRIGDWVFIEKGGDIIPKVVKVILEKRTDPSEAIEPPATCPRCNEPVVQAEDQVAVRCGNLDCPAQLERRLMHFSSRNAMDIQGLGKERVEQMVAEGLLKNLASIYDLTMDDLEDLERFGEKSIENLLREILASKQQPFSRLLFAVGIPMIGEKVADLLVQEFGSYERLCNSDLEAVAAIHGLGEKVAKSLLDHLASESFSKLFEAFAEHGLQLAQERVEIEAGEQPLAGKTAVVTGTFQGFSRKEISDFLKRKGAKVTATVTKKTDFLVAGEKAGSKLAKAEALGTEIVDEDWVNQWENQ